MVDTEVMKFKKFDESYQPEKYFLELADRTRMSGVTLRRYRGLPERQQGSVGEYDADEGAVHIVISIGHCIC